MVATKLAPTTRFAVLDNVTYYWVETMANKNSPTRSELNAGTDLTDEVAEADGWSIDTDLIDAPDIGTGFVAQLNGRRKPADSSLKIYMSGNLAATDDVRELFAVGDTGFIVRFDDGDVATGFMDVFPVAVRSMEKEVDADSPSTVTVMFRITSVPAENVAVPA